MHPRTHILLTTLAAAALRRGFSSLTVAFWAGGALADIDHLAWHALRTRRLDPLAAWQRFSKGEGATPTGPLILHRLLVIAVGLALTRVSLLLGAFATGLAFHRLLDAIDERYGPRWRGRAVRRKMALRREVYRRAGYRCEACGAGGVKLEAHHRVPREQGGRDELDNLVALCVACHGAAHL